VLPERRLFSRDEQQPSASVVISVRGEMSGSQIATIRNLVATAVPGLQANRITLADDQGRLLAAPSDAERRPDRRHAG
jgi:flagellar M-ring protein FliF